MRPKRAWTRRRSSAWEDGKPEPWSSDIRTQPLCSPEWISWKGSSTGIVLSGVYRRAWRNANSVGAGVRFVEANTLRPHEWHSCRSEEHTSELQSLMRNLYAVFSLQKKKKTKT